MFFRELYCEAYMRLQSGSDHICYIVGAVRDILGQILPKLHNLAQI